MTAMLRFEKSVVIEAPVEDVFAYIVNPTTAPEYFAGVDAVKDVQRLPDGRYTFTFVTRYLGLQADLKTEQIEVIPNQRLVAKGHSALMDITMTLQFEKLESRKALWRAYAECSFPGGPLAKFGEPFLAKYLDHVADMTVEAGKARIEAGVPTGATR